MSRSKRIPRIPPAGAPEPKKELRVKNEHLSVIAACFGKIQYIAFEDALEALKKVREKKKLAAAAKDFEEIRESLLKKYGVVEGAKLTLEQVKGLNEEYGKFADAETTFDSISPIPWEVVKSSGLTPRQLEILEEYSLIKDLPA